jgi:hypothetical protein
MAVAVGQRLGDADGLRPVAVMRETVVPAGAEAPRAPVGVDGQHVGVTVEHPARRRGGGRAQTRSSDPQPSARRRRGPSSPSRNAPAPAPAATRRIRRSAPMSGQARPCARRLRPRPPRASVRGSSRCRACVSGSQDHPVFRLPPGRNGDRQRHAGSGRGVHLVGRHALPRGRQESVDRSSPPKAGQVGCGTSSDISSTSFPSGS